MGIEPNNPERICAVINTILFDNWNTLVQAPRLMRTGASVEIFQQSLRRVGLKYDSERFTEIYRSISREQMAESEANGWTEFDYIRRLSLTLEGLGVKEPQRSRLAICAWDDYMAEWPRQTSFYPETPRLLENLKGRYKLGVVTNFMDGPIARRIFDDLDYKNIFDSLIISAEVGYMKPAPILFEKALEELDTKPENALMVGDSYDADIVGAHAVGVRGVLIDLYGAPQEHLRDSDAVINTIGGLSEALKMLQ